jgi:hypothetical protein
VQSGVTPTAGGVVFFGDMGGNFYALDADTGEKLWGQKIGGAIGGGVITYETNGQQSAVATGLTAKSASLRWFSDRPSGLTEGRPEGGSLAALRAVCPAGHRQNTHTLLPLRPRAPVFRNQKARASGITAIPSRLLLSIRVPGNDKLRGA